jgi:putative hydrolase of the HAD superfamily
MQIKLVLVDFDDTLVITEPRFQNARRVLFERLAAAGFEEELCRTVHEQEVDPEMLQRYGLGPGRLEHSFRETYTRLCDRLGHALEEALAEEFAVIGRGVAGPSEPIEGALEALRTLAARYPTAVYTQAGNHEYQLGCLRAAGVLDVVPADRVRICERKSTDEFRAAMLHFGAGDPRSVWMIGNSVRSDLNPALAAGANAILVGNGADWVHEQAEPISTYYVRVQSFTEAAEYLVGIRDGTAPDQ